MVPTCFLALAGFLAYCFQKINFANIKRSTIIITMFTIVLFSFSLTCSDLVFKFLDALFSLTIGSIAHYSSFASVLKNKIMQSVTMGYFAKVSVLIAVFLLLFLSFSKLIYKKYMVWLSVLIVLLLTFSAFNLYSSTKQYTKASAGLLPQNGKIAILTQNPQARETAITSLKAAGLDVETQYIIPVSHGVVRFTITIVTFAKPL
jgi:hypothetical protein